jgi:hypothetical protein
MAVFYSYILALASHWLALMSAGPFLIDRLVTWFWPAARRWLDGWHHRRSFLLGILLVGVFAAGFLVWKQEREGSEYRAEHVARTGTGGGGSIVGDDGKIIGGIGCPGGGNGGGGTIKGNKGTIIGGDAGCGPTPDGRGGRTGRTPGDVAEMPTNLWQYGRGAPGANAPEYDRRLDILRRVHREYLEKFPDTAAFIEAGVDQVPISWVNTRLKELEETWRVSIENGSLKLPPLAQARP